MAVTIEMPKLSDTQSSGVLAKWNVSEGDEVSSGDVVAEVETDKATMDVEVFDSGTILKILVDEGTTVPLGEVMAVIGEEGEDISDIVEKAGSGNGETDEEPEEDQEKASSKEEKEDSEEQETEGDEDEAEESSEKEDSDQKEKEEEDEETKDKSGKTERKSASSSENGRIKASPLARKMAEEKDIDLNEVEGSGPLGRIVKRDIETYESTAEPSFQASREDTEQRVSQMRKTIARRLSESKFSSPHYYETVDINAKQLIAARSKINDIIEGKISFNDIIVKACAAALRKHPMVNSSWQEDIILQHGDVNVGVAVAVGEGLVAPVINHTDQKGLEQISAETKDLAEQARNKNLDSEQLEGGTFTVSNLGMFGIEEFTAIINPPNAAILAVGAIRDVPVVEEDEVVPGKRMKLTLSSDHRVVDGATAAKFLQTLQNMLENPLSMLV